MDLHEEIRDYLLEFHQEDIRTIQSCQILEEDVKNFSILVDLTKLERENKKLITEILKNSQNQVKIWTDIFLNLQIEALSNQPDYRQDENLNVEKYSVKFYNWS